MQDRERTLDLLDLNSGTTQDRQGSRKAKMQNPLFGRISQSSMTYAEFNRLCRGLPATNYVVQWGGSHVWKVGGKVFAVGGLGGLGGIGPCFTFKVGDLAYEMLKGLPGLRPAPYLASRGLKWIQHFAKPGLSDPDLRSYIRQSHRMVAQGLAKRTRLTLGLE